MNATTTARSVRRRRQRHPAEITSDRLLDHYERWFDKMDGLERDCISRVRQILEEIADGTR